MKFLFFAVLCLCCFESAFARKAKGATPKEIDSLFFFDPISFVDIIGMGGKRQANDSLSQQSYISLKEALSSVDNRMKFAGFIQANGGMKSRIEDEIIFLIANAANKKDFGELNYKSVIDSILDASSRRFALLIVVTGFVRTNESFKKENRKNVGVSLMTFGTYEETAIKSGSRMHALIFDARKNEICYYKETSTYPQIYGSPLSKEVLNNHIKRAFGGFFWPKPNNNDPYR